MYIGLQDVVLISEWFTVFQVVDLKRSVLFFISCEVCSSEKKC